RARWHGTLMLVGQPAEEIVSGAAAMIRDGLFTRFPKPDFALGMHDDASLPAGVVGFHSGFFRAASTSLDMTVYGRGGHGAYPQSTIDPVLLAARIVVGLQTIVSRENNPADPAVITVGSIHGGSAWNIIPDTVKLQLTVRSLDPKVQQRLLSAIERQANGEAQAANAPKQPLIETKSSTGTVYNDPALTQRAVAATRAALGTDKVAEMPALMGSEDFSQFGLAGVTAVLLHVGAVDAAKLEESHKTGVPVPGVHSPLWAPVREPTIKAAIGAETAILTDLMKGA
ncbi:MAG TPA: amidohydrolase, partial [Rudaea sp.]|nr:amidohydrolase [Rudaea sp.]